MLDYKNYVLYTDMDGTLLTSWDLGPIISKKNKEAIKEFINNGGEFSVATGRNIAKALPFLSEFKINIPLILANGSLIYSMKGKKILKYYPIPNEFYNEMLDLFYQFKRAALIFAMADDQYAYVENEFESSLIDFELRISHCIEPITKPILKMSFIGTPEDILFLSEKIKTFSSYSLVNAKQSSERFLEIVHKDAGKEKAFAWIEKHHYLEEKKTIYIGDHQNDCEIMKLSDIRVAPNNADSSVKKIVQFIVSDNNNDTLYDFLNSYFNSYNQKLDSIQK